MNIKKNKFGSIADKDVYVLEMSNDNNLKVLVSNLGASIIAIFVPDRAGKVANIVLGYESLQEYQEDTFYMGAVIGRFAGRVSNGSFFINGREHKLVKNAGNSGNHIHGGVKGFNKKLFSLEHIQCNEGTASVRMYYKSEAMEEAYPGNLDVWVNYELTNENELTIRYEAITDEATHVNLTNHSYFNLGGTKETALEHELYLNAEWRLTVNKDYIPTGAVESLKGTIYDFSKLRKISEYLNRPSPAYNDYYILNNGGDGAVLFDPVSRRKMIVTTSFPGLMFYTGDFLSGDFMKCQGVCLETQFFPDAPNRPEFPSTLLLPGEKFDHKTSFKFSW